MKRMMTLLIALLVLALMLPAVAETKVPVIGILQYVQHPALDAAREGFIKGLADEGFVEGENIKLDIQNANADQSTASTIADHFIGQDTDLVLAIATPGRSGAGQQNLHHAHPGHRCYRLHRSRSGQVL